MRLLATAACAALAVMPLACDLNASSLAVNAYGATTAHRAYGYSLAQARLLQTALGHDWLAESEAALTRPESVALPFERSGEFLPSRAQALGFAFRATAGRRLYVDVSVRSDEPTDLFIDLFERGGGSVPIASAPGARVHGRRPANQHLEIAVHEGGDYVLRVQPELLRGASFRIRIDTAAMLTFPVRGHGMRSIQSAYGAAREGGRLHRGVDIFADRGTEVLAAADGWIVEVDETPKGGNIVWMDAPLGNVWLYYAHLDSRAVQAGQFVASGDVIGTVGNTGNAVTTPAHLHFGVYRQLPWGRDGVRDPVVYLR